MQHHKARRLIVLILTAILLLGGCKEDTSFILPPETTDALLQATDPTHTTAATVPTVEDTIPTETTTAPTEATTAPTEATTVPTEATTVPTSVPTEPVETQPKETTPAETTPTPTEHRHSYTKTVEEPTCTKKGCTLYTCTCGSSYSEDRKDALGHSYKLTTVPPTTSQRGYDLHQCTRCGDSYKDNYTEKLPGDTSPSPTEHKHSYTETEVNPTCTAEGYTEYACTCGDSYQTNHKSALGHDYKVTVVVPTVTQQGYNLHECTRCGDSYKDNYVDKLPEHTDPPETEPPQTEPPANSHPVYNISDHVVGSLEYEILADINARRAAEGLGELKMDKKLCALAAIRAYEASISFSHTRPDGSGWYTVYDDYHYSAGLVGENLLHCSPSYSASQIVDVWMKSTSHKNNILSGSFTKAGLGIYYADGRMYVANLFAG